MKRIFPVVGGAVLGYTYYHFIGCNSGSCAITSNPYISTAYGAFLGLIFAIPSKKKNEKPSNN
ncbi:MAG: hypothetical protein KDC88_01975 [Ignavibacteriae bacterium]|nr:hypothetical protein [Ignavibacteriota bacterium]MCB9207753.1 hypothetical protein [Ignavibacteriales bacterium]MCB9258523.1 hypothetical protein [Ignavibacteriales bacterium]